MIDEDGNSQLWSKNSNKWTDGWRIVSGGKMKLDEATEMTHLSEEQVRAIYILQHHGKYADIAAIEDISNEGARSRVHRVREKRDRSENTLRVFAGYYSNFKPLNNENLKSTRSNLPNVEEHDWRQYSEDMGLDVDLVEEVTRKTWLSPVQSFVVRCMRLEKDMDEIAEVMGVSSPPSSPGLSLEKAAAKRYIPKLRNHRRRSYNTLQFLDSKFDFKEFSHSYSYD